MKLAVGAPVAERAWILPRWFECLKHQTVQPDYFCFVYSKSEDTTRDVLDDGARLGYDVRVYETKLPYYSRDQRNADPNDQWRADHMARLRNRLKTLFMQTDADVFLSLDTDILLEDETVIEELTKTLCGPRAENPRAPWDWEVVTALTYLHPLGVASEAYNAGMLTGGEGYTQGYRRLEAAEVMAHRSPLKIDVPMAAYVITRQTMGMCCYAAHECGEDIGFAQSLKRGRFRVGWRTDVTVRHVWDHWALETTP